MRPRIESIGGGGFGGGLSPEVFDPASVEVKFGDPMVDAPRLLELYTEETTIEHLQGIVPFSYIEEIINPDTGEVMRREIPATTVEDIKKEYENPNLTLLTAETPSGFFIGVATVTKLSDDVAEIGKVVVDSHYRGRRIVDHLTRAATALAFREGSGGLDCRFAQAFVIIGSRDDDRPDYFEPMPGYHVAQNAFRRQGYEARSDREGATRSWSNRLKQLITRTSQPMELTRRRYKQLFPEDHIKYFPTLRPPKPG